jgi:phosphomannomutase
MLAEIAKVEGFHFEDTLTGFKWIGARAHELSNKGGHRNIFCYEEAIGFCCGDVVFDKDGVSALCVVAELAYSVYRQGRSLAKQMQSLYDTYGEFVCNNGYFFYTGTTVVPTIMEGIRNGGNYVSQVGPYKVESIRDLGEPGFDSTTDDKKPTLPTSKSSPMLTLRFENGCVAQFRASGTEPKFKYYIEMRGKPGVSRCSVSRDLMEMSDVILEVLLKPSENGLSSRL